MDTDQRVETFVPYSAGTRQPARAVPAGACDAHMHIFDPCFAISPHWKRRPPVASVDVYRRLQRRLGTERTVVVTPSTYGTDNACTLHALQQLGASARGVVVVDPRRAAEEAKPLRAHPVRGLRVNFVTPQPWGTTTPDMLHVVARVAADAGWHVQVFAHGDKLLAMKETLRSLPCSLVLDHTGLIDPAAGDMPLQVDVLRRLLDKGNTWVKLSGAYMRSKQGPPSYGDVRCIGEALLRHAPERMVWGSDWPHTTEPLGSVDDADLLDVLAAWCDGRSSAWKEVLVDNPAALYGFD